MLHAVDDLLVEVGYSAMTMKGIADRAGVGRMTIYRWWPHKAAILLEACIDDAREALTTAPRSDPVDDVTNYYQALIEFLTQSPAGAAYRALIGEAQHDDEVAALLAEHDVLGESATRVIDRIPGVTPDQDTIAGLVGPVVYLAITHPQPDAPQLDPQRQAASFLAR